MLKPERIAEAADIRTREIYRRIETGKVHFVERNSEDIFVCIQTLTGDRSNINTKTKGRLGK